MAGLQRSEVSFRRQGSSGLVWDDRFLSGELNQKEEDQPQQQEQHGDNNIKDLQVNTNGGARGYRTGKVSPAIEPPSPKLSACGFCSAFGKTTGKNKGQRSKPSKHRAR